MSDAAQLEGDRVLDAQIDAVTTLVFERYGYDFRHNARASLRRRVQATLAALGLPDVPSLCARLEVDPPTFTVLLNHVTVPVSEMFRDPEYYAALRRDVVPILATYPIIRIWVAACSRGEEAYSMAILLDEAGVLGRSIIYATDLNPDSLRMAEAGVFAVDRAPGFTRNYQRSGGTRSLADYYTAAYDGILLDRRLAARITFAEHCLASDAAFGEMHFVSCRNALIYFDRTLQDRAVGLFVESLVPRGFLGIGSRESLRGSAHAGALDEMDFAHRIYRRKP